MSDDERLLEVFRDELAKRGCGSLTIGLCSAALRAALERVKESALPRTQ